MSKPRKLRRGVGARAMRMHRHRWRFHKGFVFGCVGAWVEHRCSCGKKRSTYFDKGAKVGTFIFSKRVVYGTWGKR